MPEPTPKRRAADSHGWIRRHAVEIVLVYIVVVGTASFVLSLYAFSTSRTAADDAEIARQAQLASCEIVGNPLLDAQILLLRDELSQQNVHVIEQFFPDVPPQILANQLAKSRAETQGILDRLLAIPSCEDRFPAE